MRIYLKAAGKLQRVLQLTWVSIVYTNCGKYFWIHGMLGILNRFSFPSWRRGGWDIVWVTQLSKTRLPVYETKMEFLPICRKYSCYWKMKPKRAVVLYHGAYLFSTHLLADPGRTSWDLRFLETTSETRVSTVCPAISASGPASSAFLGFEWETPRRHPVCLAGSAAAAVWSRLRWLVELARPDWMLRYQVL